MQQESFDSYDVMIDFRTSPHISFASNSNKKESFIQYYLNVNTIKTKRYIYCLIRIILFQVFCFFIREHILLQLRSSQNSFQINT